MASSNPNFRVLAGPSVARELDLALKLFHRINRIIPEQQSVLHVAPETKAFDALALMKKHGFSQVPVVKNGEVLGVFSFRSFASQAAATLDEWQQQRCAPGELPVDEFLEQWEFHSVTQEISRVFDTIDRDNGVLIGTQERLLGVLTPMDFLRYLYQVASPFVMISEIELAIRELIHRAMSDEQIALVAKRCLAKIYKSEDRVPTVLEEMSFDNLKAIVSHTESWPLMEPILGGSRARASGKLEQIRNLRNDVFHFKREITIAEHEAIADVRDWLLSKVRQADVRRRGEAQP